MWNPIFLGVEIRIGIGTKESIFSVFCIHFLLIIQQIWVIFKMLLVQQLLSWQLPLIEETIKEVMSEVNQRFATLFELVQSSQAVPQANTQTNLIVTSEFQLYQSYNLADYIRGSQYYQISLIANGISDHMTCEVVCDGSILSFACGTACDDCLL